MLAKDDVSNKYLVSSTNEKSGLLRRTSSDYEAQSQSAFQLGLGSYSIKDGIIGEKLSFGAKARMGTWSTWRVGRNAIVV